MKKSWFHHHECTTEEAEMLMARYRANGVRTERNLNPGFVTWTVSAYLPTSNTAPRPSRIYQQKCWGKM